MENKLKRKFRFKRTLILAPIMMLILLLSYFEFVHDIYPSEAIDFFELDQVVQFQDNAAFALAGITAPAHIKDFHQWGYKRWSVFENMPDSENLATKASETATPKSDKKLHVVYSEGDSHHVCWQPGSENYGSERFQESCVSREELESLLAANALIIDRYLTVANYENADFVNGPGIRQNSIEITKLVTIKLWLTKDSFSRDDLLFIADLLHFWRSILDNSYLDQVNLAVTLVNIGLSLNLFHQTARIYPELLGIYIERHGDFDTPPVNQSIFDRIAVSEFYFWDTELCMSKEFDLRITYCNTTTETMFFKPGRTMDLMFRNRHKLHHCFNPDDPRFDSFYADDIEIISRSLLRPGNYIGREHSFARYFDGSFLCDAIENLRFRNDVFALYRLYLWFKVMNYGASQIEGELNLNNEVFRVPESDRYVEWDAGTKSLILRFDRDDEESTTYELVY